MNCHAVNCEHALAKFDTQRNAVGLTPLWISVSADNRHEATIDWNHRPAVRAFAAWADDKLRNLRVVTTRPDRA